MTFPGEFTSQFAVSIEYSVDRAVLHLSGELDLLVAAEFSVVLDRVIDRLLPLVVLDMSKLQFIDGSGLRVIMQAAHRVSLTDGVLALRSPSEMIRTMLDVIGFDNLADLNQNSHASSNLGSEQLVMISGPRHGSGSVSVQKQSRSVAAIPADHDVVDGALRLVVALARATVEGADGVSVSLRRQGRLATVAASDRTILDMDAGQYATGEGPCVDASVEGRWFHVESLRDETRWPAFAPLAQALGINAILSSPLLAGERPVGSINIYSKTTAAFGIKEQELASVFASEASLILDQAGVDVTDGELSARVAHALWRRQIIAQAQGVIMEREGVDSDSAYAVLRNQSVKTSKPLSQHAQEIVASTCRYLPAVGEKEAHDEHG